MRRYLTIFAMAVLFCVTAAGQAPPVSMGIVLDTSGSMSGKMALARQFVSEVVKSPGSQDEFALIQAADRPVLVSGFASAVGELPIYPKGRSALLDAIYLGAQIMKTAHHERKVLLVISDGADNSSRYAEAEINDAIRETGVRVFLVGINEPVDAPALLSRAAGRFGIDRTSNLPRIAGELGTAMRARP